MITPLQISDVPDAVSLLQAMRAEARHPAPIDSATAEASLKSWLEAGTGVGFIARSPDGAPTGLIAGLVTPDWLCGDLTATVMVWYAREEEKRGAQLIRAFLKESRRRRAARIMAGTMVAFKNARLSALYAHLGFVPLEAWWFRNL